MDVVIPPVRKREAGLIISTKKGGDAGKALLVERGGAVWVREGDEMHGLIKHFGD